MNKKKASFINRVAILTLVIASFLLKSIAYGETSIPENISATIRLSICGDTVVEGEEDCEGEDLNGQTCEGLGFGPGTLDCDIACSFITSGCSPAPTPTPTPTPTSTPTLTLTPTPAVTSTPVPGLTSTPGPGPTATPGPAATATVVPTPSCSLPTIIRSFFDPNVDCKIETAEVYKAVKIWVDEWREYLKSLTGEIVAQEGFSLKCDINRDEKCDLFDLSVLLYYVGG